MHEQTDARIYVRTSVGHCVRSSICVQLIYGKRQNKHHILCTDVHSYDHHAQNKLRNVRTSVELSRQKGTPAPPLTSALASSTFWLQIAEQSGVKSEVLRTSSTASPSEPDLACQMCAASVERQVGILQTHYDFHELSRSVQKNVLMKPHKDGQNTETNPHGIQTGTPVREASTCTTVRKENLAVVRNFPKHVNTHKRMLHGHVSRYSRHIRTYVKRMRKSALAMARVHCIHTYAHTPRMDHANDARDCVCLQESSHDSKYVRTHVWFGDLVTVTYAPKCGADVGTYVRKENTN